MLLREVKKTLTVRLASLGERYPLPQILKLFLDVRYNRSVAIKPFGKPTNYTPHHVDSWNPSGYRSTESIRREDSFRLLAALFEFACCDSLVMEEA